MSQRITKEQLDGAVSRLNDIATRKYKLYGAYGGYQLVVQGKGYERHGGIETISFGFGTKSELYYTIHTIIRYLEAETNQ